MESARDKQTGEIVDAEQLCMIKPVDTLGYECRGCAALVTPCSYKPENKVRPYFRAIDGHKEDCDVDGETELVKLAQKQRVTTREGFPGSFPDRLVLHDTRSKVEVSGDSLSQTASSKNRIHSKEFNAVRQNTHWAAQTIRPISRTYLNYPYDRDLPLSVPGIRFKTYQSIFHSLKSGQIVRYSDSQIFFAPISWKTPVMNDDHLEIQLSYGLWEDRKLISPYRVKVDWSHWSTAKRNYVSKELELAKQESINAKKSGDKEKGWIFFVGKQDAIDPTFLHVDDHRLICCIVAEMIYP